MEDYTMATQKVTQDIMCRMKTNRTTSDLIAPGNIIPQCNPE